MNNFIKEALVAGALAVAVTLVLSEAKAASVPTTYSTFSVPNNPVETSTHFSNKPVNGRFEDKWEFTVTQPSQFAGSVTTIGVGTGLQYTELRDFTAILDSDLPNQLYFDYYEDRVTGGTMLYLTLPELSLGNHSITVRGNNYNGSYGGDISVAGNVTQTPIPAGIWLFGSAVACIAGVSKRRGGGCYVRQSV